MTSCLPSSLTPHFFSKSIVSNVCNGVYARSLQTVRITKLRFGVRSKYNATAMLGSENTEMASSRISAITLATCGTCVKPRMFRLV